MSRTENIYARLPVMGQHLAVSAFGASWAWARFGPGYWQNLKTLLNREHWSADEWEHYTRQAVATFAGQAVDNVPYYRESYSPGEKAAARDGRLADLPLLEKSPLRGDPKQFLDPTRRPRQMRTFHTAGSSGTPVATYWSSNELRASMALREARSARWAGVSFAQPRATFSGRMIEPDPDSNGPFYRFNAIERQVYLSPFHLGPRSVEMYVRALRRHRVQWATGYAVSFALLAGFILDQNIKPLSLKAVITTSEKLTDSMRDRIGRAFGCQVFEEYSSVENIFFASECQKGSLHVSPDAGTIEILGPDGSPVPAGETGEVVATGLLRRVHPLIRYRIGDRASWATDQCSCGRGMPVIAEVSGRMEDVVVGPDGRQLVRFHGIYLGLPQIIEGQVVQKGINHYQINLVVDHTYDDTISEEVTARFRQRVGDVKVQVIQVDRIPRSKSGKFQAVVSELDKPI